MSRRIRLSEWARQQGVHRTTAWRWISEGTFPAPYERTPGGLIMVVVDPETEVKELPATLYARVSSSQQRGDLQRQVERLRIFANARGWQVDVITEVGSGLNGGRKKLLRLLSIPGPKRIVVEYRDRLARFGTEYLEALIVSQGGELVIVESGEQKLDIVQDFMDLVTSMCARIYGRRAAKHRAQRAIAAAESD